MGQDAPQTFTDVQPIVQTFTNVTPIGSGEEFIKQNQMSPFNRQANEFLLGAASGASGLPESQSPISDSFKAQPQTLGQGVTEALKSSLGPAPAIAKSLYQIAKEGFSARQAGESPEDTAARRAHAAGTAVGTVAPIALGEGIEKVGDNIPSIPSAQRAGGAFQDLSKNIGEHPVPITDDLSRSLNALRKATLTTNTNIPPVVRKLIDRLDPLQGLGPLNYDDARAFSSEINQLSASDKMSMTDNTHRLVSDLNQKLKGAVQETADAAGKGQQLSEAMKEYRQAMQLKGFKENAIEYGIKSALGAAGLYGVKKLWDLIP